jgi:hypothetical protein
MNDPLELVIQKTVFQLLQSSLSEANIQALAAEHASKVHFVPIRYRIIGGILQGLNIKFGNFIELLMRNIVEMDGGMKVMPDSGKKLQLSFTHETDALIDTYVTGRQLPGSPDDCSSIFESLLRNIVQLERAAGADRRQVITKDVDGLFKTPDGIILYTEIKYNDDHDTGKFVDINRKFIKTWAGLAVRLGIKQPGELVPILYYFNATKRYGPIYTPSKNIMRGAQLFDRYLKVKYADVDKCLAQIGDDPKVLQLFDEMYERVRRGNMRIIEQGKLHL